MGNPASTFSLRLLLLACLVAVAVFVFFSINKDSDPYYFVMSSDVSGLYENATVYSQNFSAPVGTVTEIATSSEARTRVKIKIMKEHGYLIRNSTSFYIDRPLFNEHPVQISIYTGITEIDSPLLPSGSSIEEANAAECKVKIVYDKTIGWVNALQEIVANWNAFFNDLDRYLASENFKRDFPKLIAMTEYLAQLNDSCRQTLVQDILPRLEQKIRETLNGSNNQLLQENLEILKRDLDALKRSLES